MFDNNKLKNLIYLLKISMSGKVPLMNVNDGFNFALYLSPPQIPMEQTTQERDKLQLEMNQDTTSSCHEFDRISKNSKIKNFLSNDLVKNLENFSPTQSYLSVGSQFNNLTLNEIETEKKNDDFSDLISPINLYNSKHFRYDNNNLEQKAEKSIIQLISPANNDKQAFDFSKNNFLPRKNDLKNVDNKNEININYYANNININNNNYYNIQINDQNDKISIKENNNDIEFNKNYSINNNGSNYHNLKVNNKMNNNLMNRMENFPNKQYINYNLIPQNSFNNFNNFQQSASNNYKDQIPITNQVNKTKVNITNFNNERIEKKKRQFTEREGDWVCMKCRNLNFSFRVICNRCQVLKSESEIMYLQHINNLNNLNRQNDILQSQIFNHNLIHTKNSFNSNMFSQNTISYPNPLHGILLLKLGKNSNQNNGINKQKF